MNFSVGGEGVSARRAALPARASIDPGDGGSRFDLWLPVEPLQAVGPDGKDTGRAACRGSSSSLFRFPGAHTVKRWFLGRSRWPRSSKSPNVSFEYYGLPRPFDDEPVALKANIRAVPTGVVYRDGKEIGRIEGGEWKIPELALKTSVAVVEPPS